MRRHRGGIEQRDAHVCAAWFGTAHGRVAVRRPPPRAAGSARRERLACTIAAGASRVLPMAQQGVVECTNGCAMKPLNGLFSSYATTIFEVMSKLANECGAVNLGQGFPDEEGPESMKKVASSSLYDCSNQYPSLMGTPELRQAVAAHSQQHQQLPLDWASEVLVTAGAQEGIAVALMGLCNPGDEVIMFEPLYDSYAGMCQAVGARVVAVQLQPPAWSVPWDDLEAAFSPATKLVLVNTPHNPTGKVWSREELERVSRLVVRHNAYLLSDEVYEHLVHPGEAEHVSPRTLPGMADRTIRLNSAGKTFSFTAWKVGWMTGPHRLLAPCIKAHQFNVFTVPTSLQQAVAYGLQQETAFYRGLGPSLAAKRQLLAPRLSKLGFDVLPAQGTYFLVADAAPFLRPDEDDVAFCLRLTREAGVTLIPVSAFYVGDAKPRTLVRFCFCKDDAKLLKACERLEAYLAAGAAAAAPRGS